MRELSLKKVQIKNVIRLDDFLKSRQKISFIELYGFMTGIICSPYFILPSEWLEMLGLEELLDDAEEIIAEMFEIIMSVYNHIGELLEKWKFKPQALLKQLSPKQKEVEFNKNLAKWTTQFLAGLCLDKAVIDESVVDDDFANLLAILMVLSLKDKDLQREGIKNPEEMRAMGRKSLSKIINYIYDYYLKQRNLDFEKALNTEDYIDISSYKIGRNEPCPCGSGKKYKKCCLVKER